MGQKACGPWKTWQVEQLMAGTLCDCDSKEIKKLSKIPNYFRLANMEGQWLDVPVNIKHLKHFIPA